MPGPALVPALVPEQALVDVAQSFLPALEIP